MTSTPLRGQLSMRNALQAILALTLTTLLTFSGAQGARAHDQLISTNPADRSSLDTAPDKLTLKFSAKLLNLGHELVLADAQGGNWSEGKASLEGENLIQPVKLGMPAGQYEARWRVVSSDGHPISGSFRFAVGEPVTGGSLLRPVPAQEFGNDSPLPEANAGSVGTDWSWLLWPTLGAGAGVAGYLAYLAIGNARQQRDAARTTSGDNTSAG